METLFKQLVNCLAGSAFALAMIFIQFSGTASALLTFLLVSDMQNVDFTYCIGFYLGTASPTVVNIPAFEDRTELRQSLPEGYFLQIDQMTKNSFIISRELWWRACVSVNASTEQPQCKYLLEVSKGTPCTPEDRMDCIPASFARPYFGMSLWKYNADVGQTHLHYFILSDTGKYDITNRTNTSLVNIWYNMDELRCEYQRQLFVPCVCVSAAMVFVILVISPFFWASVCMCIRKKLARRVTR